LLAGGLLLLCLPQGAWAKWYILTGALPNNVFVIDAETDTVVKEIPLSGRGPIYTVVPNPAHPQFAYVVTDSNQGVAVVDLDEGKEVTRFALSKDNELVRTMAVDVNPQGNRLYIHEMPLKKSLGRYDMQDTRIRVIDLDTTKVVKVFQAPRQIMSLASSKDGKRLYGFSVGRDVYVMDPQKGELVDVLPLMNRNITGEERVDGLPLWHTYQENDFFIAFAAVVKDSITENTTLGVSYLDLSQPEPELQVLEVQPYTAENWTVSATASPKTQKAYFAFNSLWKVDLKTRQIEATAALENTHFSPFISPDGKKVYCGANWHFISVFDAETLTPLTKIELNHPQAGAGLRFVQR
jgi:DNA-binding beta-propeller fold protein YncE